MTMETIPTYQVISRLTGLVELEGTYSECFDYFNKVGCNLSIKKADEPLWNEEGNYNAIESN